MKSAKEPAIQPGSAAERVGIDFEVIEAEGGSYEVLCTVDIKEYEGTCAETARAKYAQKELDEIEAEITAYIESGEEFDPSNPIPPTTLLCITIAQFICSGVFFMITSLKK